MVVNYQTRAIANDVDPISLAATLDQAELDKLELERLIESAMPSNITDRALLQRAKDRLDKFAFVGFVERFKESVTFLAHTFGWKLPGAQPHMNVSTNRKVRQEVPAETMEMLRECTHLDAELYRYAQQQFLNRQKRTAAQETSA